MSWFKCPCMDLVLEYGLPKLCSSDTFTRAKSRASIHFVSSFYLGPKSEKGTSRTSKGTFKQSKEHHCFLQRVRFLFSALSVVRGS